MRDANSEVVRDVVAEIARELNFEISQSNVVEAMEIQGLITGAHRGKAHPPPFFFRSRLLEFRLCLAATQFHFSMYPYLFSLKAFLLYWGTGEVIGA